MILTLFIMGCAVTFTGLYQFDAQRLVALKIAAIPVLLIGAAMMLVAIWLGGAA